MGNTNGPDEIKLKSYDELMKSIEEEADNGLAEKVIVIDNYAGNVRSIRKLMVTAAGSFCAIGYYLKQIRDLGQHGEHGHKDVWEMARAEFGFSSSATSRLMTINDQFSEGGNSPDLDPRYRQFNKSQLQEMIGMTAEDRDKVTPDATVKEIRALAARPKAAVTPEAEAPLPGQVDIWDYTDGEGNIDLTGSDPIEVLKNNFPIPQKPKNIEVRTSGPEHRGRKAVPVATSQNAAVAGSPFPLSPDEIQGLQDYIDQHGPVFEAMGGEWEEKDPRTYQKKRMALVACEYMLSLGKA